MEDEQFQLVDRQGHPVGSAGRRQCHGNPALIHAVVHLHVTDGRGNLYLQKRALDKDLYPGFWDTAVGGHVQAGEAIEAALLREAHEELGLQSTGAVPLFSYLHSNPVETEFVFAFGLVFTGALRPNPAEILEGRFFSRAEIEDRLGASFFTPNFEQEYGRLKEHPFLS